MNQMLNYAVSYGSPLTEMLVAKLTCFYNKAILGKATRMIILLPMDNRISETDLHKTMFDEIVSIKFDAENVQFWSSKNLYKILHFMHSSSNLEYQNIYIDHGKIFQEIPPITDQSICVCGTLELIDTLRYVNKQLNTYCELPLLYDTQLVFYDFSIFFIPDDIRPDLQKLVRAVAKTYPTYIDIKTSYAIMSCLLAHLTAKINITVSPLNLKYVDINDNTMIRDFYTLI